MPEMKSQEAAQKIDSGKFEERANRILSEQIGDVRKFTYSTNANQEPKPIESMKDLASMARRLEIGSISIQETKFVSGGSFSVEAESAKVKFSGKEYDLKDKTSLNLLIKNINDAAKTEFEKEQSKASASKPKDLGFQPITEAEAAERVKRLLKSDETKKAEEERRKQLQVQASNQYDSLLKNRQVAVIGPAGDKSTRMQDEATLKNKATEEWIAIKTNNPSMSDMDAWKAAFDMANNTNGLIFRIDYSKMK